MMTTQKVVIARAKMCETDLDRITMTVFRTIFLLWITGGAHSTRYIVYVWNTSVFRAKQKFRSIIPLPCLAPLGGNTE